MQRFGNCPGREKPTMTRVRADAAMVSLELDSRPQSVTLVRSALSGLGERLGLDAEPLDDLKTAVSEACNNVVIHAYAGDVGPLVVSVGITPDTIDVLVRDRGTGIQRVSAAEDRMGVGLAVISALTARAEFLSGSDGGTDVRMSFKRTAPGSALVDWGAALSWDAAPVALAGDIVISVSPASILGDVVGRLVRAAAAGSHFSVDRFCDLYPITDAIAAYAERSASAGPVTCAIVASSRRLELAVGPFAAGTGSGFTRSPDGALPMAGLADEFTVEELDGFELLRVVVVDPRPAAALSR
jgi:anti-sigma regulatory factor (Ser/Thr protein kinase)